MEPVNSQCAEGRLSGEGTGKISHSPGDGAKEQIASFTHLPCEGGKVELYGDRDGRAVAINLIFGTRSDAGVKFGFAPRDIAPELGAELSASRLKELPARLRLRRIAEAVEGCKESSGASFSVSRLPAGGTAQGAFYNLAMKSEFISSFEEFLAGERKFRHLFKSPFDSSELVVELEFDASFEKASFRKLVLELPESKRPESKRRCCVELAVGRTDSCRLVSDVFDVARRFSEGGYAAVEQFINDLRAGSGLRQAAVPVYVPRSAACDMPVETHLLPSGAIVERYEGIVMGLKIYPLGRKSGSSVRIMCSEACASIENDRAVNHTYDVLCNAGPGCSGDDERRAIVRLLGRGFFITRAHGRRLSEAATIVSNSLHKWFKTNECGNGTIEQTVDALRGFETFNLAYHNRDICDFNRLIVRVADDGHGMLNIISGSGVQLEIHFAPGIQSEQLFFLKQFLAHYSDWPCSAVDYALTTVEALRRSETGGFDGTGWRAIAIGYDGELAESLDFARALNQIVETDIRVRAASGVYSPIVSRVLKDHGPGPDVYFVMPVRSQSKVELKLRFGETGMHRVDIIKPVSFTFGLLKRLYGSVMIDENRSGSFESSAALVDSLLTALSGQASADVVVGNVIAIAKKSGFSFSALPERP